ncbi:hypothetical protein ACOME3_003839 [Neoechinorhynchus agilis]
MRLYRHKDMILVSMYANNKCVKELLSVPGNDKCADCGTQRPTWASVTIGVFLCIKCAGAHRKLGVQMSRVRSIELDRWTNEQLDIMQRLGNARVNARYEAKLPQNFKSRGWDESYTRDNFVDEKYIQKQWFSECGDNENVVGNQYQSTNNLISWD